MSLIVHYNLDFNININEKICKAQKGISFRGRLYNILLINALLAIYKSFFQRIYIMEKLHRINKTISKAEAI